MEMICEITALPDISLPQYVDRYGAEARTVLAAKVFSTYELLAGISSDFTFSLRYLFSPEQQSGSQLRIFLIAHCVGKGTPQLGEALFSARRLLGTSLHLQTSSAKEAEPSKEMRKHVSVLSRRQELLEPDSSMLYRVDFSAVPSGGGIQSVLDEILLSLEQPSFLEIQARPSPESFARDSLVKAIEALEENDDLRRTFFAKRLLDEYRQVEEALDLPPLSRVSVIAGSKTRGAADMLLAAFGRTTLGTDAISVDQVTDADSVKRIERLLLSGGEYIEQVGDWFNPLLRKEVESNSSLSIAQVQRLAHLSELPWLHGGQSLKALFEFPVPHSGGLRTFPLETESGQTSDAIEIDDSEGELVIGYSPDRLSRVSLPVTDLTRHAFVSGVTGSGKTVTMMNLLRQLHGEQIPFIVFEPAKSEYRALALAERLSTDIRIVTAGNELINPLRWNPFRIQPQISLSEHVSSVVAAFSSAIPMEDFMPTILEEAVFSMYEDLGWGECDLGEAGHPIPSMSDLLAYIERTIDSFEYDQDSAKGIKAAFRNRVVRLTRGSVGAIFSGVRSSPSLDDILSSYTIVELESLLPEHANLVIMFFLMSLRQKLREHVAEGKPRLVIVLEEAHNLVPSEAARFGVSGQMINDAASRAVSRLLVEMRALGLAVIVVDQSPGAVASEVIRSTNLKIAHRSVAAADREVLADSMMLDNSRYESLGKLRRGECYIYAEHLVRPLFARLPLWRPSKQTSVPPSNDELVALITDRPWRFTAAHRFLTDLDDFVVEAEILISGRLQESVGWSSELLFELSGSHAQDILKVIEWVRSRWVGLLKRAPKSAPITLIEKRRISLTELIIKAESYATQLTVLAEADRAT